MNSRNRRNVYLCCPHGKKDYFLQKLKSVRITPISIVDDLADSDVVLCIQRDKLNSDMQEELLQAKEYGIEIKDMNQYLFSDRLLQLVMDNSFPAGLEELERYDFEESEDMEL